MVGFTNSFRYKNFSLSMLIDGRFGGKIFSGTNWALQNSGNAAETVVNGKREDIVFDGVIEQGEGKYAQNTTAVDPAIVWCTLVVRRDTILLSACVYLYDNH